MIRRDHRAAAGRTLDDDHAPRKPRHDPVARRKTERLGPYPRVGTRSPPHPRSPRHRSAPDSTRDRRGRCRTRARTRSAPLPQRRPDARPNRCPARRHSPRRHPRGRARVQGRRHVTSRFRAVPRPDDRHRRRATQRRGPKKDRRGDRRGRGGSPGYSGSPTATMCASAARAPTGPARGRSRRPLAIARAPASTSPDGGEAGGRRWVFDGELEELPGGQRREPGQDQQGLSIGR